MTQNEKMTVCFNNIQIASLSANAGVFTGENTQSGWRVQWKNNFGFGQIAGSNNVAAYNVNVVNDNDRIDSIAMRSDGSGTESALSSEQGGLRHRRHEI